jgi:hypothetical protein
MAKAPQTGADQGGILAARKYGLKTGGWIPKGFLTEEGPQPQWEKFGLVETKSSSFGPRTYANVHDSDGTLRVAKNFNSGGEKCTLNAIIKFKKHYIDIHYDDPLPIDEVVQWIKLNKIKILNVAGNRESVAPGIQKFTEEYLTEVFKKL